MYRILIHKATMAKDTFVFYSELQEVVVGQDDLGNDIVKKMNLPVDFDDEVALKEKYIALLEEHKTTEIMPIDVLKVDLDVTITDETT